MNMEHVVRINGRTRVITRATDIAFILDEGRQWAVAFMESKKMLQKHVLTGRFMCVKIK